MKYSGALLAILAVPLIVIGGVIAIGLKGSTAHAILTYAALAYGVGTVTTTIAAASRKLEGIDEHAISLYGVLVGASLPLVWAFSLSPWHRAGR